MASSYRLGSPRSSRMGPPSAVLMRSPPPLLYELPSGSRSPPPASTRSPPPLHIPSSPPSSLLYSPPRRPLSPEAYSPRPTRPFAQRRVSSDSNQPPRTKPTPPPPRSATPQGQPFRQDLDTFTAHCRAWYFQQDEAAGERMTKTLATVPPSQRAPYSRLQAQIRSSYHTAMAVRREAEYTAHLNSTQPGHSLSPAARNHPSGELARKERHSRLDKFIKTWCTPGMPGTKPFFDGLWVAFRLQNLPEDLGGAGGRRIEWEIDDAVFRESAGKDFQTDAIDVLKGVLAFEVSTSATTRRRSQAGTRLLPTIASTTTTSATKPNVPPRAPASATSPETGRSRASSDPFLDAYGPTNQRASPGSSSVPLVDPVTPPALSRDLLLEDEGFAEGDSDDEEFHGTDGTAPSKAGYLRTWTMPDFSNPEIHSLLALFPSSVTRGSVPRFKSSKGARRRKTGMDEEEMVGTGRDIVVAGTGKMWIGSRFRGDGWDGNWWVRFVGWWKRVFC